MSEKETILAWVDSILKEKPPPFDVIDLMGDKLMDLADKIDKLRGVS